MSSDPKPSPRPGPNPHSTLPLNDIQGDILSGFPKKTETWYFFKITDATKFKSDLARFIPLVKSVAEVLKDREAIEDHKRKQKPGDRPELLPIVGVNISLSHAAFANVLNIDDAKLGDPPFFSGQRNDSLLGDLRNGDGSLKEWNPAFLQDIHGVFIVAGDSHPNVDRKVSEIEDIFKVGKPGSSVEKIIAIVGDVRPGNLSAHEHFGYLDGISNPTIIGFDVNPPPGPAPIRPGTILLGQDGDFRNGDIEPWMANGSFLSFRYLFQNVPEFDDFLDRNAIQAPGLTRQQGADLLGARLVGRWKSGAPIDITPFVDIPELGADPQRRNNFAFTAEETFQKLCPFAAHIRKTNPRAGVPPESSRIMRRGIQFGPEVTREERQQKKTIHGRGLLFASYSATIMGGFRFIQESWANNLAFPFRTPQMPGMDPIIGQISSADFSKLSGTDPNDPNFELKLPPPEERWVVPRGGEYFFSPSISGLSKIAAM